jgi:hypothetical protein
VRHCAGPDHASTVSEPHGDHQNTGTNGEEQCEGHGYSSEQCSAVGCCHWDGAGCWSAVGDGPCTDASMRVTGEEACPASCGSGCALTYDDCCTFTHQANCL